MKLPQILMFTSLLLACGDATTPDGGAMDAAMDVSATMDVPTTNIDNPIAPTSDGGCSVDGSSCGAGCANCGAGCVSILSDNTNCGGCGNTCGAGRSCQNGMCACAPGNMMCGAQCINTRTDSMHCGACDRACPMGRNCVDGTCQINCTMPTELCVVAGVSTCVNTQSDPSNCGGCGTVCTSANATAACGGGRCSLGPCNRGYGNCDRQAGNGCELNTNSDGANCGGCDNVCPSPPNASASCTAGVCGVGACNRGFGNCDANLANGCEANTNTSSIHCGACGNRCPMGQGCADGVCVAVVGCAGNPQWMPVTCITPDWVWSMDRMRAMTVAAANAAHLLATGSANTTPQPEGPDGLCSLDGRGFVSTQRFRIANCDASWYHLGGRLTGNCGGHNGAIYRLLAIGPDDCYAY